MVASRGLRCTALAEAVRLAVLHCSGRWRRFGWYAALMCPCRQGRGAGAKKNWTVCISVRPESCVGRCAVQVCTFSNDASHTTSETGNHRGAQKSEASHT